MGAAAVPAVVAGAGLAQSYFANRGNSTSRDEKSALLNQTAGIKQLTQQGGDLFRFGMPKLQQSGNYYSALLGGDRAKTTQMLAPDIANVNSVYGGTQRTVNRFLRGPDRDYARGEMERERAGRVSSLFSAARPQAAASVSQLGQAATGLGTGTGTNASSLYGDLARGYRSDRYVQADQSRQSGQDIGRLIQNLLSQSGSKKDGGGGNALPGIVPGSDSAAWWMPKK